MGTTEAVLRMQQIFGLEPAADGEAWNAFVEGWASFTDWHQVLPLVVNVLLAVLLMLPFVYGQHKLGLFHSSVSVTEPSDRSDMARSNRFRSPSGMSSFSRSGSDKSGRISRSMRLSANACAYWPRPSPSSHCAMSSATTHHSGRPKSQSRLIRGTGSALPNPPSRSI